MKDKSQLFTSTEELKTFISNQILNTTEVTEILNCTRQNVYNLVKKGHLVPIKEYERERLFLKQEVLDRKERLDNKKNK